MIIDKPKQINIGLKVPVRYFDRFGAEILKQHLISICWSYKHAYNDNGNIIRVDYVNGDWEN